MQLLHLRLHICIAELQATMSVKVYLVFATIATIVILCVLSLCMLVVTQYCHGTAVISGVGNTHAFPIEQWAPQYTEYYNLL